MSKDKHRNVEDRKLVLESVSVPNGDHLAHKELERRRGRIDKRFEKWFWGAPKFDSAGRGPWTLYWHHLAELIKRGLVKRRRTGGWIHHPRHRSGKVRPKSGMGKRTGYAVAQNPPAPGKARNERRGQSKPG